MTPDELKAARNALGLSARQLADKLEMRGKWTDRTVRAWESGRYATGVPGPVAVAVRGMLRDADK